MLASNMVTPLDELFWLARSGVRMTGEEKGKLSD